MDKSSSIWLPRSISIEAWLTKTTLYSAGVPVPQGYHITVANSFSPVIWYRGVPDLRGYQITVTGALPCPSKSQNRGPNHRPLFSPARSSSTSWVPTYYTPLVKPIHGLISTFSPVGRLCGTSRPNIVCGHGSQSGSFLIWRHTVPPNYSSVGGVWLQEYDREKNSLNKGRYTRYSCRTIIIIIITR